LGIEVVELLRLLSRFACWEMLKFRVAEMFQQFNKRSVSTPQPLNKRSVSTIKQHFNNEINPYNFRHTPIYRLPKRHSAIWVS